MIEHLKLKLNYENTIFFKMNVLLNLGPLKKGGGQNVGLNFLHSIRSMNVEGFNFVVVTAKGSDIHKWLKEEPRFNYIEVPANPAMRILFELLNGRRIVRRHAIDVIYSYFGIGLFSQNIPEITGSADSNLYFPEIDFWVEYKGLSLLKRKIVDRFRVWGLKRARAVIFENEMMMARGQKLFNLTKTTFIRPSINVQEEGELLILPAAVTKADKVCLFLCGWQRNKNFALIPQLASIAARNDQHFHFVITAPKDKSEDYMRFTKSCQELGVEDRVSVIGSVGKDQLPSLYRQADFVFLLSKLESFSNNIIEAWYFSKPLVITDALWARSICKEGAIYVERDNPESIINELLHFGLSEERNLALIEASRQMINYYPTIKQRTQQELKYIKHVFENN